MNTLRTLLLSLCSLLTAIAIAEPLPLHAVWTSAYSRVNSLETQIVALRPGDDASAYLWCRTQPTSTGKEGTLVKMNTTGETLWEIHLSDASASNAYPADILVEGTQILACLTLELTNANTGIMTASISSEGQLQWSHIYTGGVGVAAYSICQDSTGGVAVAGSQQNDSLLLKLSGDGALQWAQIRDGPFGGANLWRHVRPGLSGEVYTIGRTYHPGAGIFAHAAFHSATGTVRWEWSYWAPATGSLVTDSDGNAYIGEDSALYKLNAAGSTLWTVNTTGGPPLLLELTPDEQDIFYAGELRVSGKFRYHMSRIAATGRVDWVRIMYNEINPPDSWQPYAAAVDTSRFSYVSGNRGLFLFAPDGEQYLKIPGNSRHLVTVGHNQLFGGLNPATVVYLSGFPAFSEDHFMLYNSELADDAVEMRSWVPSKTGQTVRIEFTEDLTMPLWTELSPIISTGLISEIRFSLTNRVATYRLRAGP